MRRRTKKIEHENNLILREFVDAQDGDTCADRITKYVEIYGGSEATVTNYYSHQKRMPDSKCKMLKIIKDLRSMCELLKSA